MRKSVCRNLIGYFRIWAWILGTIWTVISASSRVHESDRLRLATTAFRLETAPLRLATKAWQVETTWLRLETTSVATRNHSMMTRDHGYDSQPQRDKPKPPGCDSRPAGCEWAVHFGYWAHMCLTWATVDWIMCCCWLFNYLGRPSNPLFTYMLDTC